MSYWVGDMCVPINDLTLVVITEVGRAQLNRSGGEPFGSFIIYLGVEYRGVTHRSQVENQF